MNRLFLIGYMGVGKTTLGRALARSRGLEFLDLDHFIEARYQKTIRQLFEEFGENRFRQIESAVLKEVSEFENIVVSTGGGTPCFFDNMDYMNNKGFTVYLRSNPEALMKRLNNGKDKRPLLKDKNEAELLSFIEYNLELRDPVYSRAHIIFDTKDYANKEEAEGHVSDLIVAIESHILAN